MLVGAVAQQSQTAIAAEACTYAKAGNGLEWCDVEEGSGDSPVAGAGLRGRQTSCKHTAASTRPHGGRLPEGVMLHWGGLCLRCWLAPVSPPRTLPLRALPPPGHHGTRAQRAQHRVLHHLCCLSSSTHPRPGAMIRAHYTGRLDSNGRVFDSSYERRKPLQFKIGAGQVIKVGACASCTWRGGGGTMQHPPLSHPPRWPYRCAACKPQLAVQGYTLPQTWGQRCPANRHSQPSTRLRPSPIPPSPPSRAGALASWAARAHPPAPDVAQNHPPTFTLSDRCAPLCAPLPSRAGMRASWAATASLP